MCISIYLHVHMWLQFGSSETVRRQSPLEYRASNYRGSQKLHGEGAMWEEI